jgi:hypothetical protein
MRNGPASLYREVMKLWVLERGVPQLTQPVKLHCLGRGILAPPLFSPLSMRRLNSHYRGALFSTLPAHPKPWLC